MTTTSSAMLLDKLTVSPLDDGLVAVTVALPPDLVREYCRFLESLADFFHLVNRKSIAAAAEQRAAARALDPESERHLAAYRQQLVASYDAYTAAGFDRRQAIQSIAADLRRQAHPWRTVEVIRTALIEAGRPGQRGRPRAARFGQA